MGDLRHTPPERWQTASAIGWIADEALTAWRVACDPKVDGYVTRALGFQLPRAAYCGVARADLFDSGFYQPRPGAAAEGGTPVLLIPVHDVQGDMFDILAVPIPIGPVQAWPYFYRRTGLAFLLGRDLGTAWLGEETVRLSSDPLAWLRAWAAEPERVAAPSACVLGLGEQEADLDLLGWCAFRMLLDGDIVCDSEDLAQRVASFRQAHDRAARAARGKLMVSA